MRERIGEKIIKNKSPTKDSKIFCGTYFFIKEYRQVTFLHR